MPSAKLIRGYEVVIGLETHAQLSTVSKIFSGASTAFGAAPDERVSLQHQQGVESSLDPLADVLHLMGLKVRHDASEVVVEAVGDVQARGHGAGHFTFAARMDDGGFLLSAGRGGFLSPAARARA